MHMANRYAGKMPRLLISLPSDCIHALDEIAKRTGQARNTVIRETLLASVQRDAKKNAPAARERSGADTKEQNLSVQSG
jgi:metal-responsive CopG/Arc/MetJ family transcriptional regulator